MDKDTGRSMSKDSEDEFELEFDVEDMFKEWDEMQEDLVNSPPHYNKGGVECIDAIESATNSGFEYYLQGVIIKYLWRYRYKGKPVEDLRKAEWYLQKLIERKMEQELKGNN